MMTHSFSAECSDVGVLSGTSTRPNMWRSMYNLSVGLMGLILVLQRCTESPVFGVITDPALQERNKITKFSHRPCLWDMVLYIARGRVVNLRSF